MYNQFDPIELPMLLQLKKMGVNMEYEVNDTLEQMRQLNLTGNIIPHAWYSKITFQSGNPDLLGTVLLAEIVYWYRPVEVKDERTGQLLGFKKKFAADMLQRSLSSFAEQFGVNKRQVADALKRLEEAGLVIKKIRTIQASQGRLNNVMYVAPVPSKIAELDNKGVCDHFISEKNDSAEIIIAPDTFERSRGYDRTYQGIHSNVVGATVERGTYTEITTQITTENTAAACERRLPIAAAAFSKKIEIAETDALIGDALTPKQISIVENTAHELCTHVNRAPEILMREIESVILSDTSFTNANRDFFKKLNTIKKVIKDHRWQTPVSYIEKKESAHKKTIDPIKQELNEIELDCAHWEKMIRMSLEKGQAKQADDFKKLHSQAKTKLKLIKTKFESLQA